MDTFHPDIDLLTKEFHEAGWKSMATARELVTDLNTQDALMEIEKLFI